jgi:hypothetical protein
MTFALNLDVQLVTLAYCGLFAVLAAKRDWFGSFTVIPESRKFPALFQISWKHIAGNKLLLFFG